MGTLGATLGVYSVLVNKIAVATLVRGGRSLKDFTWLIERTRAIKATTGAHLLDNVDMLVFYERGSIPERLQKEISQECDVQLEFVDIYTFTPKSGITPSKVGWMGWGYAHMCQFWFCTFWHYVEKYDVLLRVDEDCLTYSDIVSPLLRPLLERSAAVTYPYWQGDIPDVTVGLTDFASEVLGDNILTLEQRPGGPYSNVLGLNLAELRKCETTQRLARKVLASGKCLERRWGDLPLWGEVLVRTGRGQVARGLSYDHRSWVGHPRVET